MPRTPASLQAAAANDNKHGEPLFGASSRTLGLKRQMALLAVILILATGYFYQDPGWNGNSRLDLMKALVEKGSLNIDAYHTQPDWETGDKAVFEGHYYSVSAIGSSILAVPEYFILYRVAGAAGIDLTAAAVKHLITLAVVGASFAACGLSMYWFAARITGRPWKALAATLAISLGTMLWPYSAVFYGHVPAAALLMLAFCLLVSVKPSPQSTPASRLALVGLAMGFALTTDYTTILLIVGLAAYALYVMRGLDRQSIMRKGLVVTAGMIIPLLPWFAYNLAIYHTPIDFGYAHEALPQFQQAMSVGVMGFQLPSLSVMYHLTIDPQFGLFWLCPVLVLTPIGYYVVLKTPGFRAEGLLSLCAMASMLVLNAAYDFWWGGSAFGPRFLIVALPFLIVPMAVLPTSLWGLQAVLILGSVAQMLIPLVGQIQTSGFAYKPDLHMFYVGGLPFHGFSILYDYGIPQIFTQYAAGTPSWTLGATIGLPYWLSVPALLAAESALVFVFHRRWGQEARCATPSQDEAAPIREPPSN